MLASEVIKRLQELIKEHGDLEVYDLWVEDKLLGIKYDSDITGDLFGFALDI